MSNKSDNHEYIYKLMPTISIKDNYDGMFKILAEDSVQARNKILGFLIKLEEYYTVNEKSSDDIIKFNINIDNINVIDFCKFYILGITTGAYTIDLLDEYNGCNVKDCDCSSSLIAYSDKVIFT